MSGVRGKLDQSHPVRLRRGSARHQGPVPWDDLELVHAGLVLGEERAVWAEYEMVSLQRAADLTVVGHVGLVGRLRAVGRFLLQLCAASPRRSGARVISPDWHQAVHDACARRTSSELLACLLGPCKDVPILTDELDERTFLFRIQVCADDELFG